MPDRRHLDAALGAAIFLLALLAFLPAWSYDADRHTGFVWDDDDHFIDDHLVKADDGWWRIWIDPQPGIVGAANGAGVWNYWPLTRSSFWLERRVFGLDTHGKPSSRGPHVVNVALHALNALLLCFVLRRLRVPGAELAALLFTVHPVTVESVAWITQRKALLSTFFLLLALLAWLRFEASEKERARWYLACAGAFLLALMAKTTTVMLPVVLVCLHWYERRPWTRRSVLRLAPLFAMSLVAGVTSIVFERYIGSTGEAWSAGPGERVAAAGRIVWFYLGKLVLPLGLSFNYPRWQIDATSLQAYLPLLALLALAAVLWRFRDGWARPWLLALACFVVNLFPVLGFFNVYGMRYAHVADHWQYLACTPVLAWMAGLLASLPARPVVRTLAVLWLAALSWLTWQQSGAYVDGATLWRHTLAREPRSLIASNNVGTQLLDDRRYAEAIPYFQRVIEIDRDLPEPYLNLGNALDASGEHARAAVYWQMALERDPRNLVALHNLAVARLNAGRLDEAEALLVQALDVEPRHQPSLEKLARLYQRQGRPDAIAPYAARASRPAVSDRLAGGRHVALAIWAAMAVALGGCAAVAVRESGGSRAPRPARGRVRAA
jgi:tetratricopeptide (TPR) repeat protein